MRPILVINYKAYYPHSFGVRALEIAKASARVQEEHDVDIILAPPFTELYVVLRETFGTGVRVFAQHADPVEPGAVTGFIPLEGLKELGVHGVIINHSEHKLKLADIDYLIKKAHNLNVEVLVCADTPESGAAIAFLGPHMLAIEPPELIGTGISISRAKPEIIVRSINIIRRVNSSVKVLTGAGISTGEDVYLAIKLGTVGVLVSSAVMKAKNAYLVIKEMAQYAEKAVEDLSR